MEVMMLPKIFVPSILLINALVVACSVPQPNSPLPTAESIVSSTRTSTRTPTVVPVASQTATITHASTTAPVTTATRSASTAISPTNTIVQSSPARAINLITHHYPLTQPNVTKPQVGVAFTDPVFNTALVRLTDARSLKIPGIFPDYAKREAWNVDESLLLLRTGGGDARLYDGATYKFIKPLTDIGGEDVFWHSMNPSLILYNPDNTLYSYNIATDERKKIFTFSDYAFANTRGEGNLSRDGRWYAFVGQLYDAKSGDVTFKDLLVFDLLTNQIASKMALPKIEDFEWVSISPRGNFVVVDYADETAARYRGVEVYDRNFKFIWQKPLGAGHSDLGIDANGDEVLVMDIYDSNKNVTTLKKIRLADGKETTLLEFSPLFDQHISCRNEQRPEWCFISTFDFTGRLTDSAQTWLAFEDEIFALKLDGSGEVQRIAHHYSRRYSPTTPDSDHSNYFAEPHATVSRNGDRILFGGNWRENIVDETSVDAYVVDWRR
jgi:hypothetical protein